jgi:large subunit ribosomal protein L35
MPKQKTKKGVKKRFKLTASGKVKRACSGKRHILTKKSRKRKRNLAKGALVDKTFEKKIKRCLAA